MSIGEGYTLRINVTQYPRGKAPPPHAEKRVQPTRKSATPPYIYDEIKKRKVETTRSSRGFFDLPENTPTKNKPDFDKLAAELVAEMREWWKTIKSRDPSTSRAKKNVAKLLKSGLPPMDIKIAADHYLRLKKAESADAGEEDPDGQYVKGMGNFFGRDGYWEDFTKENFDDDMLNTKEPQL